MNSDPTIRTERSPEDAEVVEALSLLREAVRRLWPVQETLARKADLWENPAWAREASKLAQVDRLLASSIVALHEWESRHEGETDMIAYNAYRGAKVFEWTRPGPTGEYPVSRRADDVHTWIGA